MQLMFMSELPKEYQKPDREMMQNIARQYHCMLKDVRWKVALISMDCNLGNEYERWFNSLDPVATEWAVPHMVVTNEEYTQRCKYAPGKCGLAVAAKDYITGFQKWHRPPNWAVMIDVCKSGSVLRPNE